MCDERPTKVQKTVNFPLGLSPLILIPLEIAYYMLTFVIITNEDAKNPWEVFHDWRPCINSIFARLNPTWDFKEHYMSPIDYKGGAIWDTSMYDMIKKVCDYGALMQEPPNEEFGDDVSTNGDEEHSRIDITEPNILEVFDDDYGYKFILRLECPCTVWTHSDRMVLNTEYSPEGDSIYLVQDSVGLFDNLTYERVGDNSETEDGDRKVETIIDPCDCKLSMESISELEKELWHINDDERLCDSVLLCIIEGVLTLRAAEQRNLEVTVGMDIPELSWDQIWNHKNLSTDEVSKIISRQTDEKIEHEYMTGIYILLTWIYHLKCIAPFDFVEMKTIIYKYSGCYRIRSRVVKDGLSMFCEF